MGGTMETQPNQHGLTQLFMSLGLEKNNPLNTLNSASSMGAATDGLGFEGVLADYMPADPQLNTHLNTKLSSLNGALPEGASLIPMAEVSNTGFNVSQEDNLPQVGQPLPLMASSSLGHQFNSMTGVIVGDDDHGVLAQGRDRSALKAMDENVAEVDDLLREQGFHAQSLVSGLLPASIPAQTNTALNPGLNNVADAVGKNTALAHAIKPMPNNIRSGTGEDSRLSLALEGDSEVNDDFTITRERFLGAATSTVDKPLSIHSGSASPASLQAQITQPLASPVVDAVPLALSMSEDPTMNSLEELANIEDVEQEGVEAKILSSERKQDEQVLKLTKGQQAWGDALAERISMSAARDIKQVTIHLDPPELGSLELKLIVKDDQQTQVQVHVQNPQVKEALESSAHRLREMLADQGLELAEFDVQTGTGQEQAQQGTDQQNDTGQQNSDTLSAEGEDLSIDISIPKNNNLLDTFV